MSQQPPCGTHAMVNKSRLCHRINGGRLEPIREVWIHAEAFAGSRLSMMRDHGDADEGDDSCGVAFEIASQTVCSGSSPISSARAAGGRRSTPQATQGPTFSNNAPGEKLMGARIHAHL